MQIPAKRTGVAWEWQMAGLHVKICILIIWPAVPPDEAPFFRAIEVMDGLRNLDISWVDQGPSMLRQCWSARN